MRKPAHVNKKNTGPIPPGRYEIDPEQLSDLVLGSVSDPDFIGDIARQVYGDWGDWRVPLQPKPGTRTYCRSGFFIHGGSELGSAGCIDVGGGVFGDEDTDRLKAALSEQCGVVILEVQR